MLPNLEVVPCFAHSSNQPLRCVPEALLLAVRNILETIHCSSFIPNLNHRSDDAPVLEDAKRPVDGHQADAYAVAY